MNNSFVVNRTSRNPTLKKENTSFNKDYDDYSFRLTGYIAPPNSPAPKPIYFIKEKDSSGNLIGKRRNLLKVDEKM